MGTTTPASFRSLKVSLIPTIPPLLGYDSFFNLGVDSSRNFNLTFPTMRSLKSQTEDRMWALQPLAKYADPNCKFMNKVNTHLVGLQTQWTPLITPKPCPPRRRARVTLQVTAHQRQHGQSKSLLSNLDRGHSLNTAVYQEVLNKKQKHLHCNKSGIYSKCPKNGFDRDNAGTQRRTLALKTFILRCLLRRHISGENSSGVHM